ncbi:hypothetical protein [uncultured Parasphingorhabdus sp.]|uniref:hypothetical protein n=1 Tax=uncultured Parasphingorhabdus sp. TaxID=2709694 RepID=UPI0030DA0991|tara:strand:- start:27114 stop:27557 length:444 start_codon:yes stop_codon:yes gene_type:complete
MLMDFQMEGGQAITAEIMTEMENIPEGYNSPSHEIRTFELPSSVWITMFTSYAVFFGALFIATGHGTAAIFALVVSMAYAVMYFGTAAVLNNVTAAERKALPPVDPIGGIETQTGWMNNRAANAQILTVPILLALFACAFAVIRALV